MFLIVFFYSKNTLCGCILCISAKTLSKKEKKNHTNKTKNVIILSSHLKPLMTIIKRAD